MSNTASYDDHLLEQLRTRPAFLHAYILESLNCVHEEGGETALWDAWVRISKIIQEKDSKIMDLQAKLDWTRRQWEASLKELNEKDQQIEDLLSQVEYLEEELGSCEDEANYV